ncbi:MAG TPA: hypothetical protein V6D34_06125 [Candidatus Sericytochromatia bacterium]|jgi:hypothetical protein
MRPSLGLHLKGEKLKQQLAVLAIDEVMGMETRCDRLSFLTGRLTKI